MAVVDEESEPGIGPAIVIVTVIVLVVLLVVLFYGLAGLHWFGFNSPPTVGASPSITPTPSPSGSPSASPT